MHIAPVRPKPPRMELIYFMKEILLTGATGYVGKIINQHFSKKFKITGVSSRSEEKNSLIRCDLSNPQETHRLKEHIKPEIIIHAAGNKNIAFCEANPHLAYASNVTTTLNLLATFPETPFIYISTDYVFNGHNGNCRENDAIAPQTIYGKTKACAELAGQTLSQKFIVLRLSALRQPSQLSKILTNRYPTDRAIDYFTNSYYSPTYREITSREY